VAAIDAAVDAAIGSVRAALRRLLAGRRWRRAAGMGGGLVGVAGGLLAAEAADAADLPEDSADLMYHSYIGGGVNAHGPALLARKSVGDDFSFNASYFVDTVSNASIDVITTASPYHEQRVETGVGGTYVRRDSLISVGATRSKEPDYSADSASIDVSQDLLGGMTTLKLGYTRGWDTVMKHGDPGFSQPAEHWMYRLGVTQIVTARWLATLNLEADSDAGYLGSPYRAARVFGADVPEVDPSTRTSRAVLLRGVGAIGEASSVRADFRYYWDTWGVRARTVEGAFGQHLGERWIVEGNARYYSQNRALFYSDDFSTAMTYMSRNRQLSTFYDAALGAKASYSAYKVPGVLEVTLNGSIQRMHFHYDDFTDLKTGQLYSFDATLYEVFVSATF
jgi:hypothetical protein